MNERLKKQKEFLLEVDKMKQIYRQTHIRGGSRQENDAEHSWHLALMAFLLEEYANEPVDITRVMKMVLIHAEGRSRGGPDFRYSSGGSGKDAPAALGGI